MILASYIRPFDAKQKIYVLDNKLNTEEVRLTSLEKYTEAVMQLIAEYDVSVLELHGKEEFCSKLQKDIIKAEQTKYNKNKIKIELRGVD